MSGIAGYCLSQGQQADEATLRAMLEAIAFRGPDGLAGRVAGQAAMGQARLFATGEEEHDPQPLVDADTGALLTGDVRLDNRDELLSVLGAGREVSDARLLLAAWKRWGGQCPGQLRGDFAFVIWDPREQVLFGARDQMGVRPLVYFHQGGRFVFASQVAAVLAHPAVPRELLPERVADAHISVLEGHDFTCTFFRDVVRLPPAHAFKFEGGNLSLWRYWSMTAPEPLRLGDDEEYAAAFREVFGRAVARRMRGGERVGAMLSGGLDSSSVVAMARDQRQAAGLGPLPTFSGVTSQGAECPERQCIEAMIAHGGLDPVILTPEEAIRAMPQDEQIVANCDDPFDFSMLVPSAMYQAAQAKGLRVVLDGVDGDLVCSLSTRWWLYLIRGGKFLTLGREIMGSARRWGRTRHFLRLAFECSLPALLPPVLAKKVRQRHLLGKVRQRTADVVLPDWLAGVDLSKRLLELLETELPFPEPPSILDRQIQLLTGPFVAGHLERYDRVGARQGIEARHPFYDLELIGFCLSLPPAQRVRGGWEKWLLRTALKPPLPTRIQWRRDRTNPAASYHWLFQVPRLEAIDRNSTDICPQGTPKKRTLLQQWLQSRQSADNLRQ